MKGLLQTGGLLVCWTIAICNTGLAQSDSLTLDAGQLPANYEIEAVEISHQGQSTDDWMQRFYRANPLNTTESMISRLSGMSLVRRGNFAMEPVLRGMNTNQLQVTLDGMQMFGACTDKMDPVSSYVELNNLQNLVITPGAAGMEFGAGVGGSLNFQLKEARFADSTQLHGSSGGRFQSNGLGRVGLGSLDYASRKLGMRANVVFREQDSYRTGNGETVPYSQYSKLNASLSGAYRLSNAYTLSWTLLADHGWDIGYPALPMDVAFARTHVAGVTLRHRPVSCTTTGWEAKVYVNTVDHAMDDTHRPNVAMHMDMPGLTRTAGFYWQNAWLIGSRHVFRAKVDGFVNRSYAEMTMYPEGERPMFMLTWPDVHRMTTGLWLADQFQWKKNLRVNASLRVDQGFAQVDKGLGLNELRIFYPDFSGKRAFTLIQSSLGLAGEAGKHSSWSVLASYGERQPTVTELFGYYLYVQYDGYDYIGNPNLKKEQSAQIQGTWEYANQRLNVRLSGFGYHFQHYVQAKLAPDYQQMTIGAHGVKTYESLPWAVLAGGEARLIWSATRTLEGIFTGQYSYGFNSLGNPLAMIPPLELKAALNYHRKNFSWMVDGVWDAPQNRVNPDFGEHTTPAFFVLNTRASLALGKTQTWNLQGGVDNLLNAAYYHHLDWGRILRPGRDMWVGLSWKW